MAGYRWTVRMGDQSALELLREVRAFNGVAMGVLLGEAIEAWYVTLTNSNATAEDRDSPAWNLPGITLPVALTKSSNDHTSIWLQPLWRRNSR